MSGPFLFLTRPGGGPIDEDTCRAFDAAAARNQLPPLTWVLETDYAVALGPDAAGLGTGPSLSRGRWAHVVSNARLDNPREVEELALPALRGSLATDPERLAGAIDVCGARCIPRILGDFAVVAWFPATRELHAARDAFGVRTLYYTERKDLFALSSNAALLAEGESYDDAYITQFLNDGIPAADHSIFQFVRAIPPGSNLQFTRGGRGVTQFWTPECFRIQSDGGDAELIEEFRRLFLRAVQIRMPEKLDVWMLLSGGLDSSSIIAAADQLCELGCRQRGMAGSITLVDTLGNGDEREYTSSLLAQYPHTNFEIVDEWMWRDDGFPPPFTDAPVPVYPFYARERRAASLLSEHNARVVLGGQGPDHYLTGSLHFLADLLAAGKISTAVRALAHWSSTLRQSLWRLGWTYGVLPLIPEGLRLRQSREAADWLLKKDQRTREAEYDKMPISKYEQQICYGISNVSHVLPYAGTSTPFEIRYPFLDRRLVEFSLRLPIRLRSRPGARKQVLRDAMGSMLPDLIRNRPGKGGLSSRLQWSFVKESKLLADLLRDPILGQLGYIDVDRLRSAVTHYRHARANASPTILLPLSLETWLQVRSGRWRSDEETGGDAVSTSAHCTKHIRTEANHDSAA